MAPRIPLRFFWLADLTVLGTAFLAAYSITPSVQPLVAAGGPLWHPWFASVIPPAPPGGSLPPIVDLAWIPVTMALPMLWALAVLGAHGSLLRLSALRIVASSVLAPLIGLALVTLILFATKSVQWSRLLVFFILLLCSAGLCGYRLLLRRYFSIRRAAGCYSRNVALIGSPGSLDRMTTYLARHVEARDFRVVGALRLDAVAANEGDAPDGATQRAPVPYLGHVDELGHLVIRQPIHEVIAIPPASNGRWLHRVIAACDYFRVPLRIVPEVMLLGRLRDLRSPYHVEPLDLPAITLVPRDWDTDVVFAKRVLDIVLSALLLLLLAPLMLLIALAIKITTPHLPVFYRWRVVGYNGVPFTGYKFTTMIADADDRRGELTGHNEMSGPVFKMAADPRVTSLGRILRKYSLNELPQVWSVLKGDMSLVGPRPAFPHELARYELWHKRKLSVRPGITCLWQVRGRNKIRDFDEWVRMDLEYIDTWSLWLDFKILARTVWAVVAGTGS